MPWKRRGCGHIDPPRAISVALRDSDASGPMAPRKTLCCRKSGLLRLPGVRNSQPAAPHRRPESGTGRAWRRLASRNWDSKGHVKPMLPAPPCPEVPDPSGAPYAQTSRPARQPAAKRNRHIKHHLKAGSVKKALIIGWPHKGEARRSNYESSEVMRSVHTRTKFSPAGNSRLRPTARRRIVRTIFF